MHKTLKQPASWKDIKEKQQKVRLEREHLKMKDRETEISPN